MLRSLFRDLAKAPLWQIPVIVLLLGVIALVWVPLWLFAKALDLALLLSGTNPKELDEAQRILTSSRSRGNHRETPRP